RPPHANNRWIHIPLTDTRLVKALTRMCLHKNRPPSCIWKNGIPDHVRSMEPSFQICNEKRDTRILLLAQFRSSPSMNTKSSTNDPSKTVSPTNHPRRTLDQFYYSGLEDTSIRDARQTVSKWTGKEPGARGREKVEDDSFVIMIDQLWVWSLKDDSGNDTLVSCSPHEITHLEDFKDFKTSVIDSLKDCEGLIDLTALLVIRCAMNVFAESNSEFADIVAIYRWAISIKAATQTEKLEAFSQIQSSMDAEEIVTEGNEELNLALEVADILDELNMLLLLLENQLDVVALLQRKLCPYKPKDISVQGVPGELHMHECSVGALHVLSSGTSSNLVHMSRTHVDSLHVNSENGVTDSTKTIGGYAGELIQELAQKLKAEKANLERLRADAARIYEMLNQLLDLEQKAASLTEARATSKQGRAVMLFTIVTIIFLPLSFFTSYFGQNVSELTGDDQNPSSIELWRVAGTSL
ncbi:hypothetical protein EJ07DRAFT_121732, partial [Lizonia empirigonia]